MKSKGNAANAEQKRFYDDITRMGCMICGAGAAAEIHHVMGSTFKHGGCAVGNWFVLALNDGPHRNWESNLSNNARHYWNEFRKAWGEKDLTDIQVQVVLFFLQMKKYEVVYGRPAPVPDDVVGAIRSLRTRGQSPFDTSVPDPDPERVARNAFSRV
jgi:hypothetical protein